MIGTVDHQCRPPAGQHGNWLAVFERPRATPCGSLAALLAKLPSRMETSTTSTRDVMTFCDLVWR